MKAFLPIVENVKDLAKKSLEQMVSVSSIPKIDRHYSDSHKILQILLLSFSCNSVVMNNKDLTKVVDTKYSIVKAVLFRMI